ncbi:MAG: PAS domain-containing protein [Gemmatimonadaceae bacterium]
MNGARSASISKRLSAWLTGGIAASSALVMLVVVLVFQRSAERSLRVEAQESGERLAALLATPLWDLDVDRAIEIGEAFASDRRVVSIVIREPVAGTVRSIRRSSTTDTILVQATSIHEGRPVGEVTLAFDRAIYRAQSIAILQTASIVALIALIVTLIAVRLVLRRLLERPLLELSALVKSAAAGDFDGQARSVGYGELRDFSNVLGDMGERILTQLAQLKGANALLGQEIAARKETESEFRLRGAALAAAANGILITDPEGRIEWANDAFGEFNGYARAEIIGRNSSELVNSGVQDRAFYQRMWDTILSGHVWHSELVNRRKDGTRYSADMAISPFKDDAGEVTHFVAVMQDITHRKLLEEQVRQSQKMESIGRLAGGIAHDFNNQLGVIIGHAELSMPDAGDRPLLQESLHEIHHAAMRSAELTRQLLTFARKQEVVPRVLDVNDCVTHSLKMLERLIGEDVHMSWQPAQNLWPILMDRSQLDQILANLSVNARDAITGVGQVTLSTGNCTFDETFAEEHADAAPGDYVKLSVGDNGSGMSAEVMARIFEPFFTTKDVGEGTGLGLATVYGAVRQNRGFVTVSSIVGTGTVFDIYLPRHFGDHEVVAAPRPAVPAPRGRETILVVEDEAAVLQMIDKALTAQGYTVLMTARAADALAVVASHAGDIHLLLTDVVMPELSGVDLAERLIAVRPRMRVLYMSGFARDRNGGGESLAAGRQFLAKPFTVGTLAAKIREVLDAE